MACHERRRLAGRLFFSYLERFGMNHIPTAQTTTVETPDFDPSLAALLFALGFSLVLPPFSV